jgi:hypothetical protein
VSEKPVPIAERPYSIADVTHDELTQFVEAAIRQATTPDKALGDLMRGYAELHNPKDAA